MVVCSPSLLTNHFTLLLGSNCLRHKRQTAKDLSHVPCKFYRVGSCTAGTSCPFSHAAQEPGHQKDVCAWFVKGNCKFGHKCALAHVLPGQSMSMDRRNKKAAQIAANSGAAAAGPGGSGQPQRDRERERERERDAQRGRKNGMGGFQASNSPSSSSRNASTLLFGSNGSTAPTRIPPSGARPPLPMMSKAAPAPAEPAPALKDTDFTSFDSFANAAKGIKSQPLQDPPMPQSHMDNTTQPSDRERPLPPSASSVALASATPNGALTSPPVTASSPFSSTTPTKPHRFAGRQSGSTAGDFGPVGSPPRSSPGSDPVRINGFSPGVSPRSGGVEAASNTAPSVPPPNFSAPGTQTTFPPQTVEALRGRGGISSHAPFSVGSLPVLSRMSTDTHSFSSFAEALDDEDMEEFVPSSLKDLLTPEEQSRRMSRTSSTNPMNGMPTSIMRPGTQQQLQQQENRHRHSRSVPGTSMLSGDLRAIWGADSQSNDPSKGFNMGMSPSAAVLGTSPSFGGTPHVDGPSPSMLHPSNASAAFLGMHHYMGREASPHGAGTRSTSQSNIHLTQDMKRAPSGSSQLNGAGGVSGAPSVSSSLLTSGRPTFDSYNSSPQIHSRVQAGAPPSAFARMPDHLGFGGPPSLLSPNSRALQAHAPGQSLPQGLAAGYSRIHLQPPSAFSPGSNSGDIGSSASPQFSQEWSSGTPGKQQGLEQGQTSMLSGGLEQPQAGQSGQDDMGGLTSMFSHLSYSSVAGTGMRGTPSGAASNTPQNANSVPMSMSRRSSAQQAWRSHPLSSPLSGPVLTNDDDDLFSFDEEK